MTPAATIAAEMLFVLALTWALPWAGMRLLAPSLAASPLAQRVNFRGRTVFVGLGAIWVFWVAGMVVLRWTGQVAGEDLAVFAAIGAVAPLVITALLFGLIDDAYGSAADRGFSGHLAALAHGRLTTGAFKLLGIGLVSIAAAGSVVGGPAGVITSGLAAASFTAAFWSKVAWTLVLGAVIALSANLVNLADLRPGRALKCYGLYGALAVAGALVLGAASRSSVALLALALLGPVVAIWPFDLGERGMLGDAGANAAGALLGFIAAWECGRSWTAVVVLALLLTLNLASERWSFTRVVDGNRVLRYLDDVGRLPRDGAGGQNSAKSSPHSSTSDG
jgi:UDP-GlcNAc:undecaprenyl-phosphate/decaprenyl-phosphate GlcNAc-1-phosphate transferase